jgi:hypothetical protein
MTPQAKNLAEAICHFKRAPRGSGCTSATPGDCLECKGIAEAVRLFGPGVQVDDAPIKLPAGGPCHICQRQSLAGLNFKGKPLCAACAPFPHAGELMLEFSDTEDEALDAGGQAGGEYLDSINKTDLATLTKQEWRMFLGKVLKGYSEFMRAEVRKYPPF